MRRGSLHGRFEGDFSISYTGSSSGREEKGKLEREKQAERTRVLLGKRSGEEGVFLPGVELGEVIELGERQLCEAVRVCLEIV